VVRPVVPIEFEIENIDFGFLSDNIVFMDEGEIVESNPPEEFFGNPKNERTKLFLSQILSH